MKWNALTNMSGNMAETSVTDFFTVPKLGRVHQCLDPTMPQKWSGPDPWTGRKLTPVHHTHVKLERYLAERIPPQTWERKPHHRDPIIRIQAPDNFRGRSVLLSPDRYEIKWTATSRPYLP